MWTCPRCDEQHADQFTECWKCVGEAEKGQFSAKPLAALPTERKLRPFSYVVARAMIGFAIGVILTMLFASTIRLGVIHESLDNITTLGGVSILSILVGLVLGAFVGIFVWVLFPYEPIAAPRETAESDSRRDP